MTVTVTVSSGQTYTVSSGETDINDIVLSGGELDVISGGTASGTIVSGGVVQVSLNNSLSGGVTINTTLLSDGRESETGASPDPERPRHLQDIYTLRKLRSHLPFGRAVYLRPAELYALTGYCKLIAKIVPKENARANRTARPFQGLRNASRHRAPHAQGPRVPDGGATPSMIEQATEAQLLFVATLERIAKGN